MKKLKLTTISLMTIFVGLCVYWAVGRNMIIKSIGERIQTHESEGYSIIHKGLSIGGFPVKFRAGLAEPNITSPRAVKKPWSLKADTLRLQALTINPLSWRGTHRGEARLDLRGPKDERWLFDVRPFNIDFMAKFALSGDLKSYEVFGTKLKTQAVIGTLPPIVAIEEVSLSAKTNTEGVRYAVTLKNMFLEKDALKVFQNIFGPRIDALHGTLLAEDLQGLDSISIENWRSNGRVSAEDWVINWGGTIFNGHFDLTTSETGLSGVIRLNVEDINTLLGRFQAANILTPSQTRNAKLASVLLPVNEQGRQEITLTLRDGYLSLFGQKIFEF